jgi:hypothetical protein
MGAIRPSRSFVPNASLMQPESPKADDESENGGVAPEGFDESRVEPVARKRKAPVVKERTVEPLPQVAAATALERRHRVQSVREHGSSFCDH